MGDKIYYVYEHVRLDTHEVFYVGIGTKNPRGKYRCKKYSRAYIKAKSKRTDFWRNVYEKCGKNIKINIVFESRLLDEVKLKEKRLIGKYGRRDLGMGSLVNMTDGGDGGFGIKYSDDYRRKRSKEYTSIGNPFYGKTHTERTKKHLSNIRQGTNMGDNNPFYGKTHNNKVRVRIIESNKKLWRDGKLKPPPPQIGKDNYFATTYVCINHNTGEEYKITGNIRGFCEEHNLSYGYVKKFKNKGKIELKKHSRMRKKALNTLNWEFINKK